jgi:hypothetical protein
MRNHLSVPVSCGEFRQCALQMVAGTATPRAMAGVSAFRLWHWRCPVLGIDHGDEGDWRFLAQSEVTRPRGDDVLDDASQPWCKPL